MSDFCVADSVKLLHHAQRKKLRLLRGKCLVTHSRLQDLLKKSHLFVGIWWVVPMKPTHVPLHDTVIPCELLPLVSISFQAERLHLSHMASELCMDSRSQWGLFRGFLVPPELWTFSTELLPCLPSTWLGLKGQRSFWRFSGTSWSLTSPLSCLITRPTGPVQEPLYTGRCVCAHRVNAYSK